MDKFEKEENLGRVIFDKNVLPKLKEELDSVFKSISYTKDKFCVYDAVIYTVNIIYIVELKRRNVGHNRYPSILMERKKSLALRKVMEEMQPKTKKQVKRIYINMYSDNKARITFVDNLVKGDFTSAYNLLSFDTIWLK